MTDIVKEVETVIGTEVAKAEKDVTQEAQKVEKTVADTAIETVKLAEKALETAKEEARKVKNKLEAELSVTVMEMQKELDKVKVVTEVKAIAKDVEVVAEKAIAVEEKEVKSHPIVSAIIFIVIGIVGTLIIK